MNNLNQMAAKLENVGLITKVRGGRLFVLDHGKELGYLTEVDAGGSTGTCKNIRLRAGYVAQQLRREIAGL